MVTGLVNLVKRFGFVPSSTSRVNRASKKPHKTLDEFQFVNGPKATFVTIPVLFAFAEPKPKRAGGGKDIANIEGMDEVLRKEEEEGVGGRPPPVSRRKKARKLTDLDADEEEEDESEEYKASE